jgi:hypothetical protein
MLRQHLGQIVEIGRVGGILPDRCALEASQSASYFLAVLILGINERYGQYNGAGSVGYLLKDRHSICCSHLPASPPILTKGRWNEGGFPENAACFF